MRLSIWSAPLVFVAVLGVGAVGFAGSHHHGGSNSNSQTTRPAASQPSGPSPDQLAQDAAGKALLDAQAKLKEVNDADWAKFQQGADWTAAQSKLTSAQSDLDTAKQAANDAVNNNPDYQTAVAAQKKAEDDLATAKAGDDATPETLSPLATAVLQAKINLKKVQGDALGNDTGVQTASEKLELAQHDVDMLKLKYQQSLLTDKSYVSAKAGVDAAQKAYDDAHQKVSSSAGAN
jgi:hypothetical protein